MAENIKTPKVGSEAENKKEVKKISMTEEEFNEAVKLAVEKAIAGIPVNQPQQVLQVTKEEYVTILFLGAIAAKTSVVLPKWGVISFAGNTLDIPKKEFVQGLGVPVNNALIRKRQIIVVDGLSPAERKRYGVDYKDGELLTQGNFISLLDYPTDKICEIFEKLCPEHKHLVGQMFYDAFLNNDGRVTLEKVKSLNEISKETEPKGMFTAVLEGIAERIVK